MTTSIKGGIPVGGNLAFRDLVYRPGVDGPAEMMPMPYYGGGMGIEQLAGGLSFPIGSQGSDVDEEELFKERYKEPGSWRQYIKDYQRQNPLQRQVPSANIGNVGGMLAQGITSYGDTIDMGPAPGTYSNMPVIPDAAEEQFQYDQMMERFRNRAFPPTQIPAGFDGKYVS